MSEDQHRFTKIWDAMDPFDPEYPHLWIKVEHLGRYIFAANCLTECGSSSVLDVGCGQGYGSAELARQCDRVTAVDSDEVILAAARRKYVAPNLEYRLGRVGTGELEALIEPGSLGGVVCFETLEHLTDPARALSELVGLLRPGGKLILSVPNGVNERTNDVGLMSNRLHRRAFSISTITDLIISAGGEVSEVLGQPLPNEINSNETRLIRRRQVEGRIGDEPGLHDPVLVRRLAMVIGYPEPRDVERSYSIIVVASKPAG